MSPESRTTANEKSRHVPLSPRTYYRGSCELGEGPVWDGERLIQVDIERRRVLVLSEDGETAQQFDFPDRVGCVALTDVPDCLLVACGLELFLLDVSRGDRTPWPTEVPKVAGVRFNDGKPGPDGCLYIGTMDLGCRRKVGELYRIEPSGRTTRLLQGLVISNGIDWSPDRKTLYHVDSPSRLVSAYPFSDGRLGPEEVVIDFRGEDHRPVVDGDPCVPDGLCVDNEGCIWVAVYGGGYVARYSPENGRLLDKTRLEVPKPTSCCLGGSDGRTLFITSCRENMSEPDLKGFPLSGATFAHEVEAPGPPPFRFALSASARRRRRAPTAPRSKTSDHSVQRDREERTMPALMKGYAVRRDPNERDPETGTWPPNTLHVHDDLPRPTLGDRSGRRRALLRILGVGLCGTDKEINNGEYGVPPPRQHFLVIGHESFAQVIDVDRDVTSVRPGDLVVATVRRPGCCFMSRIRCQDLTTGDTYYERGISLIDGFLCETVLEDEEFIVKVCDAEEVAQGAQSGLAAIGVLCEPMSVVQKAVRVAWAMQSARLPFYHPRRALVLGAGPIGQLAALALRIRGLEVVVAARSPAEENPKAERVREIGGVYRSTGNRLPSEVLDKNDCFDIVFDATGHSRIAFDALLRVAKNGIVLWNSITGGRATNSVPTDIINQRFVLGNMAAVGIVNAHLGDWAQTVEEFKRTIREHPKWLASLITPIEAFRNDQVDGKDPVQRFLYVPREGESGPPLPENLKKAIKVVVKIADPDPNLR
jgi:sugar lactone lactonase YvrE/threonine dehydrogenase-like Zn-dependent dehydrogenase